MLSTDSMRPITLCRCSAFLKVYWFQHKSHLKNNFTATARLVYAQISGYCGPAKLIHEISHDSGYNKLILKASGPQLAPRKLSKVYCHCCVCAQSLQSCLTLWDPTDCSPPGSSVHGILQARELEWVAMPSSRGSAPSRDRIGISCLAGGFCTLSHWWSPCCHYDCYHYHYCY